MFEREIRNAGPKAVLGIDRVVCLSRLHNRVVESLNLEIQFWNFTRTAWTKRESILNEQSDVGCSDGLDKSGYKL